MDAMTAQARRFYHHVHNGGVLKEHDVASMVEYMECKDAEIARLTEERDQALASVGAVQLDMRDRAAEVLDGYGEYDSQLCCDGQLCGCQGSTAHQMMRHFIRTLPLNPDATAALNDMLAKAWAEGYDAACKDDFGANGYEPNPYRKDET